MRALFLLLIAVTSVHVSAAPGLNLKPMPGDEKIDTVKTENYSGSCGSALVRFLGVEHPVGEATYRMEVDAGKVIVRRNGKDIELTMFSGLDVYSGLSCVPTKAGPRLVVWSNCGGTACPSYAFTLIDPEKPAIVTPKNPSAGFCDEKCVTTALGRKLPLSPTR